MKYPLIQCYNVIIGPYVRELTPREYEVKLQHFHTYFKTHRNDETDYTEYLRLWFGRCWCDDLPNFKIRHALHKLPMTREEFYGEEE